MTSAKKTSKRAARSEVPPNLWQVPVYLPYLQPRLTDAAIAKAEQRLGVKLPKAYLAALRVQNGGYLRLSSHPTDYAPVSTLAGIGPRFPTVLDHDWTDVKAAMAEAGITKPAGIDDLIPFAGDGHYHYCFDYRKTGRRKEPRVTYIDIETFDIDKVLAPDFGAFLHQLGPGEVETVYGLATRAKAPTVARALSKATGIRFEDQGDQDHGYRVFRARLPGDANWAWLTSNQARRGFVRKTDHELAKLKDKLPELVDRHPAHADCGYFLSSTDFESKAGKAIVRGLTKLPFPTRPLQLVD